MRGCRGQEGSHDRTKSGKRSDLCMGQRTRVAFSVEKEMRPNVIPFPLSPLHPHQPARIQPSLSRWVSSSRVALCRDPTTQIISSTFQTHQMAPKSDSGVVKKSP